MADGALSETHDILQQMNELAVQSANGTNSAADRAAIENEKKELVNELNRIANTTTFNNDIYPLRGIKGDQAISSIPMKTISYEDVSLDDIKLIGSNTISRFPRRHSKGESPVSSNIWIEIMLSPIPE